MNVDKDGWVHQPSRKWYSFRETKEIYARGGYVVLKLEPPKKPRGRRRINAQDHDPR